MRYTIFIFFILLNNILNSQISLAMFRANKILNLSYSYQSLTNDSIACFSNNFFKQDMYYVNFDKNTIKEKKIKRAIVYTRILNDRNELKEYLKKKIKFINDTVSMIIEFDTNGRIISEKVFMIFLDYNNIDYENSLYYEAKIFYKNQKIIIKNNYYVFKKFVNQFTIENNKVLDYKMFFCKDTSILNSFFNNEFNGVITESKIIDKSNDYRRYYKFKDKNGNIKTTEFDSLPSNILFYFKNIELDNTTIPSLYLLLISTEDDDWYDINYLTNNKYCLKTIYNSKHEINGVYIKNSKGLIIKEIHSDEGIDITIDDNFDSWFEPNSIITEIKFDNKDRKKTILYDFLCGKGLKKYKYHKQYKKIEAQCNFYAQNFKTSYIQKEKNNSVFIKYKEMYNINLESSQIYNTDSGKYVEQQNILVDTDKYEIIVNYFNNDKKLPYSTVHIISNDAYQTVIVDDPEDCYCNDTIRTEQIILEIKKKNKTFIYNPKQEKIFYNFISYEYFQ